MLLTFDIHPEHYQSYYQYMIAEFVPTLQRLQLRMLFAWHVQGENYPQRQVEFVCADREQLLSALSNPEFQQAEDRLKDYTMSYSRKIVRFENRFQF